MKQHLISIVPFMSDGDLVELLWTLEKDGDVSAYGIVFTELTERASEY